MRDTLNLEDLKRQAERILRLMRGEPGLASWSHIIVFVLFVINTFISLRALVRVESASYFVMILLAFPAPLLLIRFGIITFLEINGIERVRRYKPDFVRSAGWGNYVAFVLATVYSLLCLIGLFYAAYIASPLMILFFILWLVPMVWGIIYGRFYFWVRNNLPQSLERVRFLMPYNYPWVGLQGVAYRSNGAYIQGADFHRANLSDRYSLRWNYIAIELNNYAYSLIELGRYAEALPLLEAALRINPTSAPSYSTLIYYYLKQEVELERAEQLIPFVFAFTQSTRGELYSIALAQQAYLAALLKRPDQVETPFELAQDYAAQAHPLRAAEVYWHLGETARILDKPLRAHQLYLRTIETAPNTIYAQQAREQLTTILA